MRHEQVLWGFKFSYSALHEYSAPSFEGFYHCRPRVSLNSIAFVAARGVRCSQYSRRYSTIYFMYLYIYANVDRTTDGQQASTPTEAGFSLSQSCASSVCARCVCGGRLPIVGRAPGRSMVHPALIAAFHTVTLSAAFHNVIIFFSTHTFSRLYLR